MKMNEWRSSSKTLFAQWSIFFPQFENEHHIEKVFQFAGTVLELGEKYQVYRLIETGDGFTSDSGQSYVEFMRNVYKKHDLIPFFFSGSNGNNSSSRIAYYENGKITEQDIKNTVKLLKDLQPLTTDTGNSEDFASVAPLVVTGGRYSITQGRYNPKLLLRLETNIWFPRIWGYLSNAVVDNSELANIHTPRLNQFLHELHEISESLSLIWRCDRDWTQSNYYHQWFSDTGIVLNNA